VIVDEKIIDYLEDLSYLKMPDEEKQTVMEGLNNILSYMTKLDELDTTGVVERSHAFDSANDFRADVMEASLERSVLLSNAPEKTEEMFVAPMTV